MTTIAYFILAHAHPEQISRLVQQLNTPHSRFYIHIDANTPDAIFTALQSQLSALENIHFIERQACRWGGFSLVDASLRLMAAANKDGFDWGVLLSGQDYPIHSNQYIEETLARSPYLGLIDIKPAPEFDIAYRYRAWHFETLNGTRLNKALQKIQRLSRKVGIERALPAPISQVYAGSQWWTLSHTACQTVLDFVAKQPQVVDFFRHTLIPDEMFFQTILMNSPLAEQLSSDARRYLEWDEGAWSPRLLKPENISQLRDSKALFARKFAADSATTQALINLHRQ